MTGGDTRQSQPTTASETLDPEGFAVLFRRSFSSSWLIAVGIVGDRALAEDVVQDAALIALRKLDAFEPGTNFSAWLGQIVRNVALNRARKERRSKSISIAPAIVNALKDEGAHTSAPPSRPDSTLTAAIPDERALDNRVLEAIGKVEETARTCLLLRTIEGWSYARISEVLRIPEGTAMSHVHRTRKLLRALLAPSDADSAPGGDNRP